MQGKERNGIEIRREEIKLSLLTDDKVLNRGKLEDVTKRFWV